MQHLMTQCLEQSVLPISDTTLVLSLSERPLLSLHPMV